MDPKACIERFCEAIRDGDWEEAHAALEDLREWREKGGFLPDFYVTFTQDGR